MGRRRATRWAIVALVMLAALAGCADENDGADGSAADVPSTREPLDGFGEVAFRVERDGERMGEWCALLAETGQARSQGLMDQDDTRGYDAMVFRYEEPTTTGYYMFHTRIPLSIAWFGADGDFVSSADMTPCSSEDPAMCPRYHATAPFLHAVEVPEGGLDRLGMRAGSTLSFGGAGCATE
jgi:uncharacterized membrane protein (UPF0127 family)